jgi:hypothetical protein
MFNFFFVNNGIFKRINDEDMERLGYEQIKYLNGTCNYTAGGFMAAGIMDFFLIKRIIPGYKLSLFSRLLLYPAASLLSFKYCKDYTMPEVE